jgi:hypothetical protein
MCRRKARRAGGRANWVFALCSPVLRPAIAGNGHRGEAFATGWLISVGAAGAVAMSLKTLDEDSL